MLAYFTTNFARCTLVTRKKNAITLPHSAQRKHAFFGEIKQISQSKKIATRKGVSLELLHHILGHISNRSLMDGDTANVW